MICSIVRDVFRRALESAKDLALAVRSAPKVVVAAFEATLNRATLGRGRRWRSRFIVLGVIIVIAVLGVSGAHAQNCSSTNGTSITAPTTQCLADQNGNIFRGAVQQLGNLRSQQPGR